MNNVFKALIITAPAVAILFFYVVIKQSEHQAFLERESARFDQEFTELAKPRMLPGFNETFWRERQEKARKEEEEAQRRLEEKRKKAEQIEQEFEKAMNETRKEDLERILKSK